MSICIFWGPIKTLDFLDNEIHAFVYSIIILNVASNPLTLIKLENEVLNYIGKISYGIYAYHQTIIFIFSLVVTEKLQDHSLTFSILTYFILIIVTILLSHISFKYYEAYFLGKKHKYSSVPSTN
jgi:peptidoglycan/LPS O-acetylase OafA/YrhL